MSVVRGDAHVSNWIPSRRIAIARTLALGLVVAAIVGYLAWTPLAVLGIPALGATWVAFVMSRIRSQLSGDRDGGGWEQRIHALVVDRLALPADASVSVLDVGCGEAALIGALLERSPSLAVTGIDLWSDGWDYSQQACERRLARRGHHAELRRMDAGRLEFTDDRFDAVVSVMCFHEVPTTDDDAIPGPVRATAEALRVLQPGGTFVLVDRFDDHDEFDPAALDAVLGRATDIVRTPLASVLDVPWPLSGRRSLGPVVIISGTRAS